MVKDRCWAGYNIALFNDGAKESAILLFKQGTHF